MANPKENAPATPHPRYGATPEGASMPVRVLMATYRFLASLKLAVFTILGFAAILAYGTWFEREYGNTALQEIVYKGTAFSIFLTFLALNILCAALIRFPWKKRQTGFVITHAGLLTLIFGSWWGLRYSDEGQVGAAEGGLITKLTRTQDPLIRIRQIDSQTGKVSGEYEIPFKGGFFDWPQGKYQVVSQPKDPFKVGVKAYHPASLPKRVHVASTSGTPMLKLRPMVKPPSSPKMVDVFETPEDRWFVIPERTMGHRKTKQAGPAKFAFLYADKPEIIDDFLNPPANPGILGVARLHYVDKAGKPQTHEVRIDDAKADQPFTLPDSDLTVSFRSADQKSTENAAFVEMLGDNELSAVKFNVRKGTGPEIEHAGFAAQPMIPAILPTEEGAKREEPLLSIGYFRPPTLGGPGMMGTFGVIEVMGTPDGSLFYRVFGRDETPTTTGAAKTPKPGVLKGKPAPLKIDENVVAFGGNPNLPMTLTFRAEQYLPSGEDKIIYESFELPVGQRGNGLAAALVEMTVGDETKEFWIHKPPGLDPVFDTVLFKSGAYEIAYDCDRKDLDFSLKLNDFDVGFDPGTAQASSFKSEVTLTDEKKGIKDKPISISMNQPLTHRNFTFYQQSYEKVRDPHTKGFTGEYKSLLQVGYDAGREWKYLGAFLIVLGTFVQFYLRPKTSSTVSDVERHRAADKARRLLDLKASQAAGKAAAKSKKAERYDDDIL